MQIVIEERRVDSRRSVISQEHLVLISSYEHSLLNQCFSMENKLRCPSDNSAKRMERLYREGVLLLSLWVSVNTINIVDRTSASTHQAMETFEARTKLHWRNNWWVNNCIQRLMRIVFLRHDLRSRAHRITIVIMLLIVWFSNIVNCMVFNRSTKFMDRTTSYQRWKIDRCAYTSVHVLCFVVQWSTTSAFQLTLSVYE